MTLATNTTLGTITLTGDLSGAFNVPELVSTGVTPGEYIGVSLVSDSKGRTIYAKALETVDIPCASNVIHGIVQIGDNITDEGNGLISLEIATTTRHGVVKVGSGFEINGCVLSLAFEEATDSTLGFVAVPTSGNIDVDIAGNISVPIATDSTLGVCKVDNSSVFIDGAGELSVSGVSTAPIATDSTLGVCKVDNSSVLIDAFGELSVDYSSNVNAVATQSSLGQVQVPSSGNIDVDGSGNITIPTATDTTLGLVKVVNFSSVIINGSGQVTVTSGAPASVTATESILGYVIVPTSGNIDIDVSSNITIPTATDSVLGACKVDNINVLIDGAGTISLNGMRTDITQTITKTQMNTQDFHFGSNITLDLSVSNIFKLSYAATSNILQNPTNIVPGMSGTIIVTGTGINKQLTLGSYWKSNEPIVITTTSNSVDLLQFICVSPTEILVSISHDHK